MTATAKTDLPTGPTIRFTDTGSVLTGAADQAVKNAQAFADSFSASFLAFEQVRGFVVASATRAVETQIANSAAFAKAKGPKEVFELQQQFARDALDAYVAGAKSFTDQFATAYSAALKPLAACYADLTPKA
jgi:hypothetical protein